MRRFLAAMVLSMAVSTICDAKDVTYKLTGENTKIEWTGSKPEGKHTGGFKKLTGTATKSDTGLKLDVQIDCDSLYSDDEKLTKHLLSPDLFSVKEHPKAKFKSTKIEKTAAGHQITGQLTLLGKTKEISFPAEIKEGDKLTIHAEFKINRQDYGMNYGTGKINDDVDLKIDVKASGK